MNSRNLVILFIHILLWLYNVSHPKMAALHMSQFSTIQISVFSLFSFDFDQVCNCSMFCCTLLYVHSSIAIILMVKRELVALLILSSRCLVIVEWFFLAVSWGCLWLVIVVFPDHTHLLFLWQISFVFWIHLLSMLPPPFSHNDI